MWQPGGVRTRRGERSQGGGGKLAPEESAQKSFWRLFRAEKRLSGGKDGSKVLLALATRRRKGRPYLHTQARRPSSWDGTSAMRLAPLLGNRPVLARDSQSWRTRAELSRPPSVTEAGGKRCRQRSLSSRVFSSACSCQKRCKHVGVHQSQLGASFRINIKYLLYVSRRAQVEMRLGC